MGIKIKHRNPQSTDFSKNDIVINVKEGALFFKSELGVHRLVSEVQTAHTPDYGPHPVIDLTPYALNTHTHTTTTVNYFYESFASGFGNSIVERALPFIGSTNENTSVLYYRQLLMPFDGTLHKLFWKQTGLCTDVTIKVYQNIEGQTSSIVGAVNNVPIHTSILTGINVGTGSVGSMGIMNELALNLTISAGDHILISMQAASDGIHEMTGQLLYSQDVTI